MIKFKPLFKRCFMAIFLLSPLLLFAGCSPTPGNGDSGENRKEQEQQETKSINPVLNRDFPDPTVIQADDGWIYAYATQSEVNGETVNMQVARSQDLLDWEHLGDAMPDKPGWADETQDFWAPDIFYDEDSETYYLYFSSTHNAEDGHCMGVATAKSPQGPFTDAGDPIICGEGFVNIDPMAFDDPETGKKLLYWGSGFEPLKVRELADNRTEFKEGSETKEIVYPGQEDNYTNLLEGPWVTLRNGYYYLYYSGDNCCGEDANYAVMVARSKSATGPFERRAETGGYANSVILEKNNRWLAPGHNGVIEDSAGNDWMLYHAIDLTPVNGEVDYGSRVLLVNQIQYENGWPVVEGGTPSDTLAQPPVF